MKHWNDVPLHQQNSTHSPVTTCLARAKRFQIFFGQNVSRSWHPRAFLLAKRLEVASFQSVARLTAHEGPAASTCPRLSRAPAPNKNARPAKNPFSRTGRLIDCAVFTACPCLCLYPAFPLASASYPFSSAACPRWFLPERAAWQGAAALLWKPADETP